MFTIAARFEAQDAVRLTLSGKMSANALRELRREIEEAIRRRKPIVLDLSEVTLVDKPSVDFLTSQPDGFVRFENAPPYLLRWISRAAAAD